MQEVLTAYEDLDERLNARSSTLKALVLRFNTSFDDRNPSKPCECWHAGQMYKLPVLS